MAKEYVCENCGYISQSLNKRDIFFNIAMSYPFLMSLAGEKYFFTCLNCKKRGIKISPDDVSMIPGSFPKIHWNTKSIIFLILILFFVIYAVFALSNFYLT